MVWGRIIISFASADWKKKQTQNHPTVRNGPSLSKRNIYLREASIVNEQVMGGSPLSCGFNLREEESSGLFKKVAEMRKGNTVLQRREVIKMAGLLWWVFFPPSEASLWCHTKNGEKSCGGWGREVGCGRPYGVGDGDREV